jgi:hypothetical protein
MTPQDGRGSEALPPSSYVWMSVSEWMSMEIASKGLRVIFRNPDTKRTCEITYKYTSDKWHVKCFITESMTTEFSDLQPWPHGEEPDTCGGLPMLNTYDSLIDALNNFKTWAK